MATHTALKLELFNKFRTTCKEIFHLTAHRWQAAVGANILEAISLNKSIKHLCVRPTGGGRSLVVNVVATILQGFTICIGPFLSIGADQTKKALAAVDVLSRTPVTAFHLDDLKELPSSSTHPLKHSKAQRGYFDSISYLPQSRSYRHP